MATIKEIAQLAGVSRGTVDRVLNNRGSVNEETREKVLEIAKLLNYQPNKAGLALASQKRKLKIGVLLFGNENPFFSEVFEGLQEKAQELSVYGITILGKRIPFHEQLQLQALEEFKAQGVHGIILSPYDAISIQQKIDALFAENIPCITVNTDMPHSKRLAYVGSDSYKCGETAGGLFGLLSGSLFGPAKEEQIAIVTGSHQILSHRERIRGFQTLLKDRFPHIHVAQIVENEDDDYKSFDVVNTLLHTHKDLTGIFFTASGVLGGCKAVFAHKESGTFTRPLKIVTFDAVPSTCALLEKGVISATITQQARQQGALSLQLLCEYLISRNPPQKDCYYMDLSIHIRENISRES